MKYNELTTNYASERVTLISVLVPVIQDLNTQPYTSPSKLN